MADSYINTLHCNDLRQESQLLLPQVKTLPNKYYGTFKSK